MRERFKIEDVTELVTKGTTPTTLGRAFTEEGVAFIKVEAIDESGAVIPEKLVFIDSETDTLLKRSQLRGSDVLFSIAGVIGRTMLVKEEDLPANTNQALAILRPKSDLVDPRFLYYTVRSKPFIDHSLGRVVQTAQANVSLGALRESPILLPPLDEQRRIAAALSSYDDLIENNRKRIKLLERAARLLYTEWFVRGRFPGHQGVKVKDGVPEGWEKKGLHEVAQVSFGFPFASNLFNEDELGIPVIRIRDIPVGYSKTYTTEEPSPDYFVEDGDVLIGMDGDFHMRQWSGGTSWLNQRVTRLRGKDGISNALIRQVIDAPIKFLNNTITGTTVRHLSAKHLKEMKVLMPTGPLLKEASERFDDMGRMIIILERSIAVLTRARDLLLPRLMSGKVKV